MLPNPFRFNLKGTSLSWNSLETQALLVVYFNHTPCINVLQAYVDHCVTCKTSFASFRPDHYRRYLPAQRRERYAVPKLMDYHDKKVQAIVQGLMAKEMLCTHTEWFIQKRLKYAYLYSVLLNQFYLQWDKNGLDGLLVTGPDCIQLVYMYNVLATFDIRENETYDDSRKRRQNVFYSWFPTSVLF